MAPSHADPTQTTQQTAKLAETERTEKLAPTGPAEAADPKLPTAKSEGKMKKERGGPGAREKRRQMRKDEFQADADKTAKSTAPEEAETAKSLLPTAVDRIKLDACNSDVTAIPDGPRKSWPVMDACEYRRRTREIIKRNEDWRQEQDRRLPPTALDRVKGIAAKLEFLRTEHARRQAAAATQIQYATRFEDNTPAVDGVRSKPGPHRLGL